MFQIFLFSLVSKKANYVSHKTLLKQINKKLRSVPLQARKQITPTSINFNFKLTVCGFAHCQLKQ